MVRAHVLYLLLLLCGCCLLQAAAAHIGWLLLVVPGVYHVYAENGRMLNEILDCFLSCCCLRPMYRIVPYRIVPYRIIRHHQVHLVYRDTRDQAKTSKQIWSSAINKNVKSKKKDVNKSTTKSASLLQKLGRGTNLKKQNMRRNISHTSIVLVLTYLSVQIMENAKKKRIHPFCMQRTDSLLATFSAFTAENGKQRGDAEKKAVFCRFFFTGILSWKTIVAQKV